ncbi:serine/threonine protein kinase, partial [Streptomyces sp. NPDC047014]
PPPPAPAPAAALRATAPPAPRRRRRARGALLAGGAVLAVLAAGLGYAFVGHDAAFGRDGTEPVPVAATSPEATAVRVVVSGTHTTYAGSCPPPDSLAPTFTATFTASGPGRVSYRWVSDDGSVVDPHWRVLTLGGPGTAPAQDTVRLTAYAKAGTLDSRIGVEIRDPVRTTSNRVPFEVTCRV